MFNILVCLKQVPDPAYFHRLYLDKTTGVLVRDGIPLIINPCDKHALEAAIAIKETHGGRITALTMGPPAAVKVIEYAFALDADDGVLLCDNAFAGSDTLATARILAGAIRAMGEFNLIFCGDESIDGSTRQVPVQLAALLGVPYVTSVKNISFADDGTTLILRKETETETLIVEAQKPVLLALSKGANEPRLPTIAGIIAAKDKTVREMCLIDCHDDHCSKETIGLIGSPTKVFAVRENTDKKDAKMFTGTPELAAQEIMRALNEYGSLQ